MKEYFQMKVDGAFRLFSIEHLLTLCVIGLLAVFLFTFQKKLRQSEWKNGLRFFLAAALLISEAAIQFWYLYYGNWSVKSSLPLELSDLAVLLAALMLATGNRPLFAFLYFAGVGSSLQAILTPDLGGYRFPHFQYIQFFTAHGLMILACLFMIAVEYYRPTFRSLWITFLLVNVYGVCIFFFDRATGANYLYLMHKPKAASLLDFIGPWPWYIISLEAMTLIVFLLLYVPFGITEKEGRKQLSMKTKQKWSRQSD
ncbi:TIGR02206 family membrane protein [Sporolactobacillus sp. THM7-4]|nr:TIGR02206 family membrane protein [Sporolactobacillus sp. THM7-4]